MILFKEATALTKFLQSAAKNALSIGFVPTMGALHAGHFSLIRQSNLSCDLTVVSIFVNPTQFNDPRDFEKYPSTLEEDLLSIIRNGADILFLPTVKEIYPAGITPSHSYDLGYLDMVLEGKYRPGHFQGVCQVMEKLLNVIQPAKLFMGQKDFQQCMVIKKMIQLKSFTVELVILPTVREADGLAMSSRNLRLSADQRKQATTIYKLLVEVKNSWSKNPGSAKENAIKMLQTNGFRIDYIEVADVETLSLQSGPDSRPQIALIAAYLENVRLIDNMLLIN